MFVVNKTLVFFDINEVIGCRIVDSGFGRVLFSFSCRSFFRRGFFSSKGGVDIEVGGLEG